MKNGDTDDFENEMKWMNELEKGQEAREKILATATKRRDWQK